MWPFTCDTRSRHPPFILSFRSISSSTHLYKICNLWGKHPDLLSKYLPFFCKPCPPIPTMIDFADAQLGHRLQDADRIPLHLSYLVLNTCLQSSLLLCLCVFFFCLLGTLQKKSNYTCKCWTAFGFASSQSLPLSGSWPSSRDFKFPLKWWHSRKYKPHPMTKPARASITGGVDLIILRRIQELTWYVRSRRVWSRPRMHVQCHGTA